MTTSDIRPWKNRNNWFELFEEEEDYGRANSALNALAERVWNAVLGRDQDRVKMLAKEFLKLQDQYPATGMGDTEPRAGMAHIVRKAAGIAEFNIAAADRMGGWFRWGSPSDLS